MGAGKGTVKQQTPRFLIWGSWVRIPPGAPVYLTTCYDLRLYINKLFGTSAVIHCAGVRRDTGFCVKLTPRGRRV